MARKELNRACKAKKRALETESEALVRKEQNRARTAKKRDLKLQDEMLQQNKTAMAREKVIENAISTFLSKAKVGPEFVCTCCHRMMYKQTVIPYNKHKYTKAGDEVLASVFAAKHSYISSDGKLAL